MVVLVLKVCARTRRCGLSCDGEVIHCRVGWMCAFLGYELTSHTPYSEAFIYLCVLVDCISCVGLLSLSRLYLVGGVCAVLICL